MPPQDILETPEVKEADISIGPDLNPSRTPVRLVCVWLVHHQLSVFVSVACGPDSLTPLIVFCLTGWLVGWLPACLPACIIALCQLWLAHTSGLPVFIALQLDHKIYRQILLPNGLRAVLIQDTVAMHQGGIAEDAWGYEADFEDAEDKNENDEDEKAPTAVNSENAANSVNEDSDCDSENESDNAGTRDAAAAVLVGVGSLMDPRGCEGKFRVWYNTGVSHQLLYLLPLQSLTLYNLYAIFSSGLAHAIEHCLFLGSEKYPGANDYDAYVSKYGGYDNAYTDDECTVYTMSIQQEFLFGGLDRMAQHFVAPLLQESSVDRELKAVESEYQLNRNDDDVRQEQLMCATAKLGHPFNCFGWGNMKSLKEIPARLGMEPLAVQMRLFFDTFYYAANMRVVVMGAYPLDVLQRRVFEIFKDVPALPRISNPLYPLPVDSRALQSWDAPYTSPLHHMGPMFDKERSLQKVFYILPVKERHALTITWQMPAMFQHWDSKPTDFLSHLLGHEAQGSLLSYLRGKGWATGCCAGMDEDSYCSFALFKITINLSETGVPHWREVVQAVYFYVGMLRSYSSSPRGWPEWIFEEMQQIAQVRHQFEDEESPDDFVEDLAEEMLPYHSLPPERLLDGPNLYFCFNVDEIGRILDQDLTPENARIDILSSIFGKYEDYSHVQVPRDCTDTIIRDLQVISAIDSFDPRQTTELPQIEPMFGTLFWCQQISEALLQDWNTAAAPQTPPIPVSLPPQNPFVPTRYDLKDLPASDSRHPLVNASIKVCVTVGKSKQWFQATVVRYDRDRNAILLSYEDEDEKWHTLDQPEETFRRDTMKPGFAGTLDQRKNKFRLLVLPKTGSGMVRSLGDSEDNEESNNFPLVPPATPRSRLPKEIYSSKLLRLWHLQDRHFHRPIADLRVQIVCEQANASALTRAVADLMAELVYDVCTETTYLASVCESDTSIAANCTGFELCFSGFDDKLLDLARFVLPIFLSFAQPGDSLPKTFPESRFEACYEILHRKYKNDGLTSSKFCKYVRVEALRARYWSAHSRLCALETLNITTFVQTASLLLSSFAMEALFHGNVDANDAKAAKEALLAILEQATDCRGLAKKQYPSQTMLKLPPVQNPAAIVLPTKDPSDTNTTVEVYIQVGKDALRERVLIDLLLTVRADYSAHCGALCNAPTHT